MVDEEGIANYAELSRRTGIQSRTLFNLLRNKIYIGRRVYDQRRGKEKYASDRGRQNDRRKVARAQEEVIEVLVIQQPAVSPARFQRVQKALGNAHGRWVRKRTTNTAVNLGVGVARCGFCGERLYCSSGKRTGGGSRFGYYVCKKNYYLFKKSSGGCEMRSIRKDHLDATLRKFTAEHLSNASTLTAIVEHAIRSHGARVTGTTIADVDGKLKELRRQQRRLAAAFAAGHMDLELFGELMAPLRRELAVLDRTRHQTPRVDGLDVDELVRLIVRGANAFGRITEPADQKTIIQKLFSEVRFMHDMIVSCRLQAQFADVGDPGLRTNPGDTGRHTDMDSDLGALGGKSRRTAQSSKGCGFEFSILAQIDLMPVPPFSLSLAEYELLPDGHKRCFSCRNVLPDAKFSGTRGVCKTCSNAQARRIYKLRRLQKKARHREFARRFPELVKSAEPSS